MSERNDGMSANSLVDASDRVAELMAAVANPSRVKIMSLLAAADRDLSGLMAETRLSKNALVNHLSLLISKGMIRRASRGTYRITPEGKRLVDACTDLYQNSMIRADEERRMLRALYSGSGRIGMNKTKMVSKAGHYKPCWVSYNGAMAGCLEALGIKCGPMEVAGWSGYSFLVNVAEGRTSPAGPTALGAWPEIARGTELLGFELEHWFDEKPYPSGEKPSPEDVERASNLFDKVRKEIEDRDRPVVLWGLFAPEYGIVNGFDGSSYLVSTFRGAIGQPEGPVLYYDLKAAGCLDMYAFANRKEITVKDAVEEAVARACRFAQGDVPVVPGFVSGPAAITEWADILDSGRKDLLDYMGNSYSAQCLAESRAMCARFVAILGSKTKGKRHDELLLASKEYEKESKFTSELATMFPFEFEGDMSQEKCRRGAELLRNARQVEEEVVKHLKRSL